MRTPWTVVTSLLLMAFLTASCQRLGSEAVFTGPLPLEKIAFDNAIPLQYGELIAVTTQAGAPNQFVLWFVKPDKTIVAVSVDGSRGHLATVALAIPRR